MRGQRGLSRRIHHGRTEKTEERERWLFEFFSFFLFFSCVFLPSIREKPDGCHRGTDSSVQRRTRDLSTHLGPGKGAKSWRKSGDLKKKKKMHERIKEAKKQEKKKELKKGRRKYLSQGEEHCFTEAAAGTGRRHWRWAVVVFALFPFCFFLSFPSLPSFTSSHFSSFFFFP